MADLSKMTPAQQRARTDVLAIEPGAALALCLANRAPAVPGIDGTDLCLARMEAAAEVERDPTVAPKIKLWHGVLSLYDYAVSRREGLKPFVGSTEFAEALLRASVDNTTNNNAQNQYLSRIDVVDGRNITPAMTTNCASRIYAEFANTVRIAGNDEVTKKPGIPMSKIVESARKCFNNPRDVVVFGEVAGIGENFALHLLNNNPPKKSYLSDAVAGRRN